MKSKFRILLYTVLLIAYYLLIIGILKLDDKLNIDNLWISIGMSFSIINCFVSYHLLKTKLVYDLLIGIGISYLSLNLCLWIGNFEPFPGADPYGIITAIVSNVILSVLFLEIAFRIKQNFKSR